MLLIFKLRVKEIEKWERVGCLLGGRGELKKVNLEEYKILKFNLFDKGNERNYV